MSSRSPSTLQQLLGDRAHLARLVDLVLQVWPEHAPYLEKSMAARTPDLLQTSDEIAQVILQLVGGRAEQVAADYRWLCDQIRDEELNFARTGAYRYSTFEQANAHVYSDDVFMERYMHGLLFSHVLWFMHLSSLQFYCSRLAARLQPGGSVMEVGSGHGLLIYLALTRLDLADAVAWDISPISLEQTRSALRQLGIADRARYAIQDMHRIEPTSEKFDLIILSHLLEHLEEPVAALQNIRHAVASGGYLFVNLPLNAPMPDHLQLLRDPDEAVAMVTRGGFRVVEIASHTTQAMPLVRALKREVAITCSIIAEPA